MAKIKQVDEKGTVTILPKGKRAKAQSKPPPPSEHKQVEAAEEGAEVLSASSDEAVLDPSLLVNPQQSSHGTKGKPRQCTDSHDLKGGNHNCPERREKDAVQCALSLHTTVDR